MMWREYCLIHAFWEYKEGPQKNGLWEEKAMRELEDTVLYDGPGLFAIGTLHKEGWTIWVFIPEPT